jgi:hypothetical protein
MNINDGDSQLTNEPRHPSDIGVIEDDKIKKV